MNKKTITLIGAGALAFLLGLAIPFILNSRNDAYTHALPADATAIARLDIKAFLHSADLSPKDLMRLLRCFSEEAAAADHDSKDLPLGLDMKRPLYAFASGAGNFGLVAAVDDDDELAAYCESVRAQGHASEITRQRGYSWVTLEDRWLLAFDDDKALLMGPAVGAAQEQLHGEMGRLLEQDKKDSGLSSPLFDELKKKDEPLAAIVAPEVFPSMFYPVLRSLKVTSQADALVALSLETDDNELELEANVLAYSDAVKAELKRVSALFRPIKASFVDNTHAENVGWMTVNVQGEQLLDLLRSNPTVRTTLIALNLVFDLDRILRAVDGDVALEVTRATLPVRMSLSDFRLKDLYLCAQVSNTDFLSGASSWGNALIGVQALSQQDFALNLGNQPLYFGVADKTFYLGSERGLAQEKNEYLRHERSDIKGARFFATFAVPGIIHQLELGNSLPASFSQFQRLNIEMDEPGDFKIKLLAPEGTNLARAILLNE